MRTNRKREVKVCPKCNSTDIVPEGVVTCYIPDKYICRNCGYTAILFPMMLWQDAKKLAVKHIEEKKLKKYP